MEKISIGESKLCSSRLAYGCWRLARTGDLKKDLETSRAAVLAAVDAGYTLFDHADIYCHGRSETAFGEVLRENPGLRKKLTVATKCGIRLEGEPPGSTQRYDFSAEYIIRSCENSLKRLDIERIDIYQLHRPDWLMDADEVAVAFHESAPVWQSAGIWREQFPAAEVALLQRALQQKLDQPLAVHQVEISLAQLGPFTDGVLDQCQALNLTPLAWSPLAGGLIGEGAVDLLPSQECYKCPVINAALDVIATARGVTRTAVALAWLMKHPAKIIPIIGSVQPERIRAAAAAADIELTREEWYRLLVAARGEPMP